MMSNEEARDILASTVTAAFARANREGQLAREDLYGLSMSGLGGCMRQAAYRLGRVPPSDAEMALAQEARAAMIGVWIHAGLLHHLAHYLGEDVLAHAVPELRVELRVGEVTVPGSTDLYTDAFGGWVVDVKSLYAHGLEHLSDEHAKEDHWWQVTGYSYAVEQSGKPVTKKVWLYLDRSSGQVLPIVQSYTDRCREKVRERVEKLAGYAQDPDSAPRLYGNGRRVRGPGDPERGGDYRCNGCPWLRRCFGPEARPGDPSARKVFAEEQEGGVAWAMREYRLAHERYAQAKQDKDFFMSVIKAAQPEPGAEYGGFEYTVGKPQMMLDAAEAAVRLRELGVPVPKKPKSPPTYVRPVRR